MTREVAAGRRLLLLAVILSVAGPLELAAAVAPTIDYSHNMRVLKLPKWTPVGQLVYRLRASDGDAQSRLSFGAGDLLGRRLLDIVPVAHNWNEADVYLAAPLLERIYNLTIFVSDSNATTQIECMIIATEQPAGDEQQQQHQFHQSPELWPADTLAQHNNSQPLALGTAAAFLVPPTQHIYTLPENLNAGSSFGQVCARDNDNSNLPVRFELRAARSGAGAGAEAPPPPPDNKFSIKYVFGPRGQTCGQLIVNQPLDYETQNLYQLRLLALNAWTDLRFDTRNILTFDFLVALDDVQDVGPKFTSAPRELTIGTELQAGDLVAQLEAQDGDSGPGRRQVAFALDAAEQLSQLYFDIERRSGQIRLKRSADELRRYFFSKFASVESSGALEPLVVIASELPADDSKQSDQPLMFARLELPIVFVDTHNEPPQFLAGRQTKRSSGDQKVTLSGYIRELHRADTELGGHEDDEDQDDDLALVHWHKNNSEHPSAGSYPGGSLESAWTFAGRPFVLDLGLGANGTFELQLEGEHANLFRLEPSQLPVSKVTSFNLFVRRRANLSQFDFESRDPSDAVFQLDIVATDFGPSKRLSSRVSCSIQLLNLNDNSPQFDSESYTFLVYENASPGQVVGSVHARDFDSLGATPSASARLKYQLNGPNQHLFRLDQDSGQLTLVGQLDREKASSYLFLVEARDSNGLRNYSRVLVSVLDVNDNGPTFTQAHYSAVLLPDGSFNQPLAVRAVDSDEPNSANSQLAYEIIAGNSNEQFTIDSLSGAIYLSASALNGAEPASNRNKVQIPSILTEPIEPFGASSQSQQPATAGKILPSRAGEVEELGRGGGGGGGSASESPRRRSKSGRLATILASGQNDPSDALEALESSTSSSGGGGSQPLEQLRGLLALAPAGFDPLKVAPVTNLIVRAHDFGVPLRSASCRVSIFNLALGSRPVSVLLNGTSEQLDGRRDLLERALGSITGSRAQIDSIESLSETNSVSVAKMKLTAPQTSSLIDLTDLSDLLEALDYRGGKSAATLGVQQQQQQQPPPVLTHYISSGDRLYSFTSPLANSTGPLTLVPGATLLPSGAPTLQPDAQRHNQSRQQANWTLVEQRQQQQQHQQQPLPNGPTHFYTDYINTIALDSADAQLERKLLIYIIIVGVCILSLLVIWMIYSCSRESQQVKIIDQTTERRRQTTDTQAKSKYANACAKQHGDTLTKQQHSSTSINTQFGAGSLLDPAAVGQKSLRPDKLSMYNGQVWFEPMRATALVRPPDAAASRRASSAPSASSLDGANGIFFTGAGGQSAAGHQQLEPLRSLGPTPRPAAGQFFPNSLGYVENLNSIGGWRPTNGTESSRKKRPMASGRRAKVAPAELFGHTNGGFEDDQENGSKRARVKANQRGEQKSDRIHRQESLSGSDCESPSASSLESAPMEVRELTSDTNSTASAGAELREHAHQQQQQQRRRSSSNTTKHKTSKLVAKLDPGAVVLDSDQELLGFDSSGTPIVATHAHDPTRRQIKQAPDKQETAAGEQQATGSEQTAGCRPAVEQSKGETKVEEATPNYNSADGPTPDGATVESQQQRARPPDVAASASDDKPKETVSLSRETIANGGRLIGELQRRFSANSENPQEQPASSNLVNEKRQRLLSSKRRASDSSGRPLAPADTSKVAPAKGNARDGNETAASWSCSSNSSQSEPPAAKLSARMQNGELLEKQSIFAMTYNGIATDRLPSC